ncbi:hypothetical protein KO02_21560 [Sphingobacterium sp. ML3W]|uniref:DUF5675 family protein n=1 Tax=Sphingobacterium sp. ML3W TaxID=1538644 RepID=UPI0004F7FE84|nr:DUF5675 family protein [Sphingobacterium sp. ML3W]AIM38990.1 hypothetical protein KO02_21560 [Sphingobacterium sp. ML3W]
MFTLIRRRQGKNSTLSHLYLNGIFICYVLEDAIREVKIRGETCIPEGIYALGLNKTAGMNVRYKQLHGGMHQGMVEVKGIPNFSLVFIHIGNYHQDTEGCLLTGSYYQFFDGDYRVLHSAAGYKTLYPLILEKLHAGACFLKISNKVTE